MPTNTVQSQEIATGRLGYEPLARKFGNIYEGNVAKRRMGRKRRGNKRSQENTQGKAIMKLMYVQFVLTVTYSIPQREMDNSKGGCI